MPSTRYALDFREEASNEQKEYSPFNSKSDYNVLLELQKDINQTLKLLPLKILGTGTNKQIAMKRFNLILATIFVLIASAFAYAQESLPNLVRRIKPSVVLVVLYDANGKKIGTGSGFCVAPGQVITNYHVVKIASRVEVHTATGGVYPVSDFSTTNEQDDLAVLRIAANSAQLPPLPVARTLPEEGERVIVIGSPRGLEGSVSDGIVSSVRSVRTGKILQITAPISQGSSGSPVVNMRGEVVGVAAGANERGQNLNFAISAESVLALVPSASRATTTNNETTTARKRAVKLFEQGDALMSKNDYARALKYFEQAITEDPDWADGWLVLGVVQKIQNDDKAAIESFQQVLKIGVDPDDEFDTYKFLGELHINLKQYKQAVENYKQAVRLKPDDAESFYRLGGALYGTHQYVEAIDAFKRCLNLKPNYLNANFMLGSVYLSAKQFAESAAILRKEIRLNPRNNNARFNLAIAYHGLGDKDSALSEYETLRRLDPKLAKKLLELLVAN